MDEIIKAKKEEFGKKFSDLIFMDEDVAMWLEAALREVWEAGVKSVCPVCGKSHQDHATHTYV